MPIPRVGSREVLIALDTAGVGPWDLEIRKGLIPPHMPRFPLVIGVDGAGVVMAAGSRVRRFKIVTGSTPTIGPIRKVAFTPNTSWCRRTRSVSWRLDLEHAGAIATTGLTALQGIDDHLGLQRGEHVIIHGGSGGVGTLAVQFAKLRRAKVLATATTIEGLELVREMGADLAIDSRHQHISIAARRFAPGGIDAVLALAGGDQLEDALGAVRRGGRLAYPNGIEPVPAKRRGVKFIAYDAVSGIREFERLNRAVIAARLKVPISQRFPLVGAPKAHEHLEAGHVLGKRSVIHDRSAPPRQASSSDVAGNKPAWPIRRRRHPLRFR